MIQAHFLFPNFLGTWLAIPKVLIKTVGRASLWSQGDGQTKMPGCDGTAGYVAVNEGGVLAHWSWHSDSLRQGTPRHSSGEETGRRRLEAARGGIWADPALLIDRPREPTPGVSDRILMTPGLRGGGRGDLGLSAPGEDTGGDTDLTWRPLDVAADMLAPQASLVHRDRSRIPQHRSPAA